MRKPPDAREISGLRRGRNVWGLLWMSAFLVCVAFWGVSLWGLTIIPRPQGPKISITKGALVVKWLSVPAMQPLPSDYDDWPFGRSTYTTAYGKETFTFRTGISFGPAFQGWTPYWTPQYGKSSSPDHRYGVMPFYVPILALLVIPLFLLRRRLFASGRRTGACRRCDYDLQGLTEPRCPECGTPFEMSSKPQGGVGSERL